MPAPGRAPSPSPWPPSWRARHPAASRLGHRLPAPTRWPWPRANLDRVRRQHDGRLLPVTFVQGSWLTPLPAALAGRGRPGGLQSALRRRRRVAGPPRRGAARARRRRWWPATAPTARPDWPTWRPCCRQAWVWLARPGAVVIELAPAPGRGGRPHGPGHGVRRRPGGAGPGRASAGPGRSRPMTGPRLVGPRPPDEALAALADGQVIAVAGRRRVPVGGSPRSRRRSRPAACPRVDSTESGPLDVVVGQTGPGDRRGVGVEQGDGDPDRPHVARAPHGLVPARPGRRGRRCRRRITMPAARVPARAVSRGRAAVGVRTAAARRHAGRRPGGGRGPPHLRRCGADRRRWHAATVPGRPWSTARCRRRRCARSVRSPSTSSMRR